MKPTQGLGGFRSCRAWAFPWQKPCWWWMQDLIRETRSSMNYKTGSNARKYACNFTHTHTHKNADTVKPESVHLVVYLNWSHSVYPGGLCIPCSQLVAQGRGRAGHCCGAAALCDEHGFAPKAGRVWHSRSKSSSRSQHSPELDVGTSIKRETLLEEILCCSEQLNCI